MKDYQNKYSEVADSLEATIMENKIIKDQVDSLKTELLQTNNEKSQLIYKLKQELSQQRDKEANKIENLEDALSTKEEEI
jgi:hypothetical protein